MIIAVVVTAGRFGTQIMKACKQKRRGESCAWRFRSDQIPMMRPLVLCEPFRLSCLSVQLGLSKSG